MNYEIDFLQQLLITIVLETTILLFLSGLILKHVKISIGILILAGVTSSFATLPYVWFILPLFIKVKLMYHAVSEISVIIIESFIYFGILRVELRKAFIISLICNLFSYGAGILISCF
ncbi:MAG: hypothetical protein JW894_16280 [Bacteroidales bacterium]|nr:hypothetical protein [Bacteroidales bacterium]